MLGVLILLAHAGIYGRTVVGQILRMVMYDHTLEGDLRNMPALVAFNIHHVRNHVGMPPREHPDIAWWPWEGYAHDPLMDIQLKH